MKKILNGWKHISGIHCGSVAIRDICNYYGHELSEPMCFGLGGGLGFYYSVNSETSPTRSIHVRGPHMEANFFNNFDLNITDWKYDDNDEHAFESLKGFIKNDIPVLIQTDIYYLDYYNSSTHFPGHIVVICGFDDEEEKFYLADTGFEDLQLVSYEHIKKARSSKVKPYPLSNNWLDIDLSEQNIDIEAAIPDALVKNAEMMLQGYTTLRGKSGVDIIKKWSDDLPDWRLIDDWKWSSRFSYQVISKRGVDGAGFRWFYRDFLSESSTYCPKINELDLVAMMDNIGNKWFDLSMLLKEISELDQPNGKFTEASSIANEIFTLEKDFYNLIINSINKI